jgi:hypothetical protein
VDDTSTGTGLVNVLLFGGGDQLQFPVEEVLEDGSWSVVITLPEELTTGPHLLTAVCALQGSEQDRGHGRVALEVILNHRGISFSHPGFTGD